MPANVRVLLDRDADELQALPLGLRPRDREQLFDDAIRMLGEPLDEFHTSQLLALLQGILASFGDHELDASRAQALSSKLVERLESSPGADVERGSALVLGLVPSRATTLRTPTQDQITRTFRQLERQARAPGIREYAQALLRAGRMSGGASDTAQAGFLSAAKVGPWRLVGINAAAVVIGGVAVGIVFNAIAYGLHWVALRVNSPAVPAVLTRIEGDAADLVVTLLGGVAAMVAYVAIQGVLGSRRLRAKAAEVLAWLALGLGISAALFPLVVLPIYSAAFLLSAGAGILVYKSVQRKPESSSVG